MDEKKKNNKSVINPNGQDESGFKLTDFDFVLSLTHKYI